MSLSLSAVSVTIKQLVDKSTVIFPSLESKLDTSLSIPLVADKFVDAEPALAPAVPDEDEDEELGAEDEEAATSELFKSSITLWPPTSSGEMESRAYFK